MPFYLILFDTNNQKIFLNVVQMTYVFFLGGGYFWHKLHTPIMSYFLFNLGMGATFGPSRIHPCIVYDKTIIVRIHIDT